MRLKHAYFVSSGIIAHISIVIFIILVAKFYDLSPRQFVFKLFERSGAQSQLVDDMLLNKDFIEQHLTAFDIPELKSPRTYLPQIAQLQANELAVSRLKTPQFKHYDPCLFSGMFWNVACYLTTKDQSLSPLVVNSLQQFTLTTPNASGHYGNGWQLAFIYSSVKNTLNINAEQRRIINEKLRVAINHYLLLLNDKSASMWHGRASLIAEMWLCVLALDKPTTTELSNTAPHLYALVSAMELTQAWPEGFNYWINSRAYPITLALSGYLQGTQPDKWHHRIQAIMNKVGLWHIYATRPDNRVEPLGDEGPRLDLKDETRRVIDIIAQTTNNPVFHEYSLQLEGVHGRESYYRGYRWGFSLFNQWHVPAYQNNQIAHLPKAEVFGLPYFGQAYIRQHWQSDASFMSYRSGSSFTHHGHYDSGHITLFKGAPLLVNSSQYQGFQKANRLDYSIRTIAKNSIVISGDNLTEIDGGQRVVLPTGSAIFSPKHWLNNRNKGQYLIGGEIKQFFNATTYTYINSDLTKAYHSAWLPNTSTNDLINSIKREVLYLRKLDVLIVRDQIQTGNNEQQAKLLYHTVNKPMVDHQVLVKGELNNGIISTDNNELFIENGKGKLVTEVMGDVEHIQLVGGKDFQFYLASVDENKDEGLSVSTISSAPKWRFEIILPKSNTKQEVFTIHRPSLETFSNKRTTLHTLDSGRRWLQVENTAVFYGDIEANMVNNLDKSITTIYQCDIATENTEQGCAVLDRQEHFYE
ncbi:heparinase II/III family protein [Thalassotalea sp. 1_MG-2023]|uniref:heparinase II/III family protein n=1 Tax=Thalassotalea sp. 1_MG-2023 TaxID=3062680 RepID=UPI0026E48162|nr:heparinase II/III family protein [Thalassotalea sp. 1_MG-2023]MDO6425494.1 heparinase II/III family protein [Thalassotalea sp. 1_MG-2023]